MSGVQPPGDGRDWLAITTESLPVGAAYEWSVLPSCGAVVCFVGTVRDHAEGRSGVSSLHYEAYIEQAARKLSEIAAEARLRWRDLGRLTMLHRVGEVALGEASVVVAVSAPHRAEAFAAARVCIDTLKASLPVWKRETWEGGVDWGTGARDVAPVSESDELSR